MSKGERLKTFRESLGLTQKTFSERFRTEQRNISKYETSQTSIPDELEEALAQEGLNIHWLATGQGAMLLESNTSPSPSGLALQSDFSLFRFLKGKPLPVETNEEDQSAMSLLPLYGQPAAAGPGQEPNQLNVIEAYIPIVFEMLGGSSPRNCGIVRVVGDSMTDMTLFNGDLAIFDRTQLDGDGVFVISIGDAVRIKRLEYRTIEQKIVISSENSKRYPSPEVLTYEQAQNILCVHGKVICWMHRHPY